MSEIEMDRHRPANQAGRVDPVASIDAMPEWLAYTAAPTGAGLCALVAATRGQEREALVAAVEQLYFTRSDWRIALHAALLHIDRFQPYSGKTDLLKAWYFADCAASSSANDPRARLALARVHWARRLPLAVLYDVATARAGETRLRAEATERVVSAVLGEAFVLEGMARAYLGDVGRAHECLADAEQLGALTVEAAVQLLLAAEPDFPEVSAWAACRLPPDLTLGGRATAVYLRAQRRRLLWLLRNRGADGRG